MDISLTTPALLFPAITLLLLAYNNKFLATATVIRQLHAKHIQNPEKGVIKGQIQSLKKRIELIKYMQIIAVASFFLCVLSMIMVYVQLLVWASYVFAASMILLSVSLLISLRENMLSTAALELELSDMED